MHYYKRNLGDYAKKAGRLTMLQHGSYTLLIDACYDREQFPTREEAIDWTWASTAQEIEAVDFVLSKFFTLIDGRYVQTRIKEEIEAYHGKASINKRIAEEREAKRKGIGTNRARTVDEPPPNQEPRTKNQEPLTKTKVKISCPAESQTTDGFARFWEAWPNNSRKVAKAKAQAFWKTHKLEPRADELIGKVGALAISRQWLDGFAPMPMTWLTQRRFEDSLHIERPTRTRAESSNDAALSDWSSGDQCHILEMEGFGDARH